MVILHLFERVARVHLCERLVRCGLMKPKLGFMTGLTYNFVRLFNGNCQESQERLTLWGVQLEWLLELQLFFVCEGTACLHSSTCQYTNPHFDGHKDHG